MRRGASHRDDGWAAIHALYQGVSAVGQREVRGGRGGLFLLQRGVFQTGLAIAGVAMCIIKRCPQNPILTLDVPIRPSVPRYIFAAAVCADNTNLGHVFSSRGKRGTDFSMQQQESTYDENMDRIR